MNQIINLKENQEHTQSNEKSQSFRENKLSFVQTEQQEQRREGGHERRESKNLAVLRRERRLATLKAGPK